MDLRYHTPLTPDEQTAHGLTRPAPIAIADRVRFSEIDPQRHVNNKAYHEWFEIARTEYFRRICDPHYDGQPLPRTVLHSATIRYVEEILPRESYIVTARVDAFRNTSYTLDQQVWCNGTLRATLNVIMVMLRPDGSGDKYPLPDSLKQRFEAEDGASRQG
ncbi:acyl-CoA thioesterase [Seohaeicola saemankumensis]|nr:acyl-CoA thioesterase [Seohaeicola saemankumensis]MCA0872913.1 acyl-CoA thioesterase [Seohaeicola saemankumensis]